MTALVRLRGCVPLAALTVFALLWPAAPAAAGTGPQWSLVAVSNPTDFTPGDGITPGAQPDHYTITVTNTGDSRTDGSPVTIAETLPAGLTASQAVGGDIYAEGILVDGSGSAECAIVASTVSCVFAGHFDPGDLLRIQVTISVAESAAAPLEGVISVSGGGVPAASLQFQTPLSAVPAPFGVFNSSFQLTPSSASAGAHPNLTTSLAFDQHAHNDPAGTVRSVGVELPPGLIGNPSAIPRCTMADVETSACPAQTAVGAAALELSNVANHFAALRNVLVYNIVPYQNEPAAFALLVGGEPVRFDTSLVRSHGAYRVRVFLDNLSEALPVMASSVTFWGIPADYNGAGEDSALDVRGNQILFGAENVLASRQPFISNPTSCLGETVSSNLSVTSWQGEIAGPYAAPMPATVGCNQLNFDPSIEALPTTNQADSPSGLDFHLNIPQNEDPEGLATPTLRDATVTLPQGLTISSAQADGLGACTAAQIDLESTDPATCPDASVIGSVKVSTPLLEDPLGGQVFLGTPDCAPCSPQDAEEGKLIHLYIQAEGSGVRVKLPGTGTIDPGTGQITTSFEENPQLPFEDLELKLKQGDRAPLATPNTCGTFTTTSDLKPWSAPESGADATPSSSFEVTGGPNGQPCPSGVRGLHPGFTAGTLTPTAAATSPFTLRFTRSDGEAEITSLKTVLPPGLSAYLRGIPYCPDSAIAKMAQNSGTAEKANPSCPAASQIGTTTAGVGPGPSPFYVSGPVFLAGPYKGAPLSVVVDTPAVAGPFDLGTVAVRAALYLDPQSAQVTAVSDPIPTSLDGIPLRLRDDRIELTRPDFTLNPTDCDPLSVGGTLLGTQGAAAELSSPFQVSGCSALPFKPKLSLRLTGRTRRAANPALRATLTMAPGSANIARAQVTLPPTELVDNAHIGTVCTRVQYAAGPGGGAQCPPGSLIGHARAFTPLLAAPLEGPLYLRSSDHPLPDLVASLGGQLHVDLDGRIDSSKAGGLRTTFEAAPDAPVSKFVLEMQGGARGLLQNTAGLCAHPQRAHAHFGAHDNAVADYRFAVRNDCPPRRHRHRHAAH